MKKMIIALVVIVLLASCTGTRPMSSCDYVRQNFGGYK
jgi:hypothetical protein